MKKTIHFSLSLEEVRSLVTLLEDSAGCLASSEAVRCKSLKSWAEFLKAQLNKADSVGKAILPENLELNILLRMVARLDESEPKKYSYINLPSSISASTGPDDVIKLRLVSMAPKKVSGDVEHQFAQYTDDCGQFTAIIDLNEFASDFVKNGVPEHAE